MKYEVWINGKKYELEGKQVRPGVIEFPVLEVKHGDTVEVKAKVN